MLLVVGLADDLVVVIDEEHGGLVRLCLLRRHLGIGHDDDLIALIHASRRSAVQTDDARASLTSNGIGLKAVAVVDVGNLHFLVLQDTRLAQQLGVDGDAAHIVEVGLLHHSTVDLCFQQRYIHLAGSICLR